MGVWEWKVTNLIFLRKRVGMKLGQGPELNISYQVIDSIIIHILFSHLSLLWQIFQTLLLFFLTPSWYIFTRHLALGTEHTMYYDILYCVSILLLIVKDINRSGVLLQYWCHPTGIYCKYCLLINVFIRSITLLMN